MRYLSEAWFEAARTALNAATPPATALTIDQHIVGRLRYRIAVTSQKVALSVHDNTEGEDGVADASFEQSYETARAVASGALDAHAAVLLGDIRFRGDSATVIAARETLQWLHDALAPVMAATDFD